MGGATVSDDLSAIFDGEAERLSTGFEFTEGPLWDPAGRLWFVDVRRSQLFRWVVDRQQLELMWADTGEGNGLTFDFQGRLLMCQGANKRLIRQEHEGARTVLADSYQGKRLNRPNDVVGRSDGSVYFTDPQGRIPEEEREQGAAPVFRLAPDGAMSMATTDCQYPNGLAFSPDERTLYVANSRDDKYIRAFDVRSDGSLTNSRVFADMPAPEEEVPDGMKVDTEGRVFCTGPGGTWIFAPDGRHLGTLRTPEVPANCAFGGPDLRTLYLTARTSLYSIRVKVPGVAVPRAG